VYIKLLALLRGGQGISLCFNAFQVKQSSHNLLSLAGIILKKKKKKSITEVTREERNSVLMTFKDLACVSAILLSKCMAGVHIFLRIFRDNH